MPIEINIEPIDTNKTLGTDLADYNIIKINNKCNDLLIPAIMYWMKAHKKGPHDVEQFFRKNYLKLHMVATQKYDKNKFKLYAYWDNFIPEYNWICVHDAQFEKYKSDHDYISDHDNLKKLEKSGSLVDIDFDCNVICTNNTDDIENMTLNEIVGNGLGIVHIKEISFKDQLTKECAEAEKKYGTPSEFICIGDIKPDKKIYAFVIDIDGDKRAVSNIGCIINVKEDNLIYCDISKYLN